MCKEKSNFLPELNWFTKKRDLSSIKAPVSISVILNKHSKKNPFRINFTFRGKSCNVIGDYIVIAPLKNRLYIKSCEPREGYKLVERGSSNSRYCMYGLDQYSLEEVRIFEGNHELKYDEFYELYYVEVES